MDEFAVHCHLEGAGRAGGGRARALSLGKFGLDSILHLPVFGGVACAKKQKRRGGFSARRRDDVIEGRNVAPPQQVNERRGEKGREEVEEKEGEGRKDDAKKNFIPQPPQ